MYKRNAITSDLNRAAIIASNHMSEITIIKRKFQNDDYPDRFITLHKKWSSALRISSINVTKFEIRFSRPYPFKFFKSCLPPILLGPFLNTLSHIIPSSLSEIPKKVVLVDIQNYPKSEEFSKRFIKKFCNFTYGL